MMPLQRPVVSKDSQRSKPSRQRTIGSYSGPVKNNVGPSPIRFRRSTRFASSGRNASHALERLVRNRKVLALRNKLPNLSNHPFGQITRTRAERDHHCFRIFPQQSEEKLLHRRKAARSSSVDASGSIPIAAHTGVHPAASDQRPISGARNACINP